MARPEEDIRHRFSSCRRNGGRSSTPARPGAATHRTPSPPASTPKPMRSRCAARSTTTDGTPPTRTPRNITFGVYPANAGWPTARSPVDRIKARTREHYQAILGRASGADYSGPRQLAADQAERRPRLVRGSTLVDRPSMRCARLLAAAHDHRQSAVNDEASTLTRRASSAPAAPSECTDPAASVAELGVLTEAMPERLRLMVTLASWCALRLRGDSRVTSRRHRSWTGSHPHPTRCGAHGGALLDHHPESDAGVRDVAIPPHVIPSSSSTCETR